LGEKIVIEKKEVGTKGAPGLYDGNLDGEDEWPGIVAVGDRVSEEEKCSGGGNWGARIS